MAEAPIPRSRPAVSRYYPQPGEARRGFEAARWAVQWDSPECGSVALEAADDSRVGRLSADAGPWHPCGA